MSQPILAVIGGSGLYKLDGLLQTTQTVVETPFGSPSSPVLSGTLGDTQMLFVARHGEGHSLTPSEVNYRANIFALKQLGATHVISVSAVGSLRSDMHPGHLVIVDQLIDRTKHRESTFFGNGIVGHIAFADPFCPSMSELLFNTAQEQDFTVHKGGTLMVMEGPAFSTRAESNMHIKLGADLIGMTAIPEAKLAREAELCYATLAMVTDFDCWHKEEEDVSAMSVVEVLNQNAKNSAQVVRHMASKILNTNCDCQTSLDNAIVTQKDLIPEETKRRLAPITRRVL